MVSLNYLKVYGQFGEPIYIMSKLTQYNVKCTDKSLWSFRGSNLRSARHISGGDAQSLELAL